MKVYRIYTRKRSEFAINDKELLNDIKNSLKINTLENIIIYNRYDIQGITNEILDKCLYTVISEPQVDEVHFELPPHNNYEFTFSYIPGQFDQRAESMAQCIQFITQDQKPKVKTSKVIRIFGDISSEQLQKIKNYIINPIECQEINNDKYTTIEQQKANTFNTNDDLKEFININSKSIDELENFLNNWDLSMSLDDLICCIDYFKNIENRNPTITEMKILDTYWSDHCRHTTFNTNLEQIDINDEVVKATFQKYLDVKTELSDNKNITLMDIATSLTKLQIKNNNLDELDISDEINACSVNIKVDTENNIGTEDWILMFKNETHNHPTEIEPYGGASTCLGGAIRDPLSGRSYVYQSMRITGAADPLQPIQKTIIGKLPQKKICISAAQGFSSYGNQIGLATGLVKEIYHPDYIAKRMEVGAVIGAAPKKNIIRQTPVKGDVIILLGGRTGNDGCGGASGSSKSHNCSSMQNCSTQVQKGNPIEERKIQRLFRNPQATKLIKKCNDFGAGGVCVAIGELCDSIEINLNSIPKKYQGLDGTSLAISESQERMAVVVKETDAENFIELANKENLEATIVAKVTENNRLKMLFNNEYIVDISRDFIKTNGAQRSNNTIIDKQVLENILGDKVISDIKYQWINTLKSLNVCSQRGLTERFDSTIGSNTVLMPLGGKTQSTEIQTMVATIPCTEAYSSTCSLMSYGFDPYLSKLSPYYGAYYAVITSITKIVSAGGNYKKCWLSFQEYFEKLANDPIKWGKPLASLLGAFEAQLQLGVYSIGGKDSMSGTFETIDVPPTLISFAVSISDVKNIISPEFKYENNNVYLISPNKDKNGLIDQFELIKSLDYIQANISNKKIISAYAIDIGGIPESITKMCFGNNLGFKFDDNFDTSILFNNLYGGIIVESNCELDKYLKIGNVIKDPKIVINSNLILDLEMMKTEWESILEPIYPTRPVDNNISNNNIKEIYSNIKNVDKAYYSIKHTKPKVIIPIFPGTNCEYDTIKVCKKYGANVETILIKNLNPDYIKQSIEHLENKINESQIIILPGGFSGADEPDGSAKFITSFLRNERLQHAIMNFLDKNDGLMCGICNGFQALIKLGLLPYGKITEPCKTSPTLTYNTICRHQSKFIKTKIICNSSPWLSYHKVGEIHNIPISHGEGRFIADQKTINQLFANNQISTQYVDELGNPSMDITYNPNQSMYAIEGITSENGKILGKMGHSERLSPNLYKNIYGNKEQLIFRAAIDYYKL